MKRTIFLWLVIMLAIYGSSFGKEKAKVTKPIIKANGELILPDKLIAVIKDKFPQYTIPNKNDYEKDVLENFSLDKKTLPYVCWGDFNGDKSTDIALVLVGKEYKSPSDRNLNPEEYGEGVLVVFHKTKKGYESFILDDSIKEWKNFIVGTQLPEKIVTTKGKGYDSDPEDPDYVQPKFESIYWESWRSSGGIFMWENGQYKRIYTSD